MCRSYRKQYSCTTCTSYPSSLYLVTETEIVAFHFIQYYYDSTVCTLLCNTDIVLLSIKTSTVGLQYKDAVKSLCTTEALVSLNDCIICSIMFFAVICLSSSTVCFKKSLFCQNIAKYNSIMQYNLELGA